MNRTTALLTLLAIGCIKPEDGINRVVIRGTMEITPATYTALSSDTVAAPDWAEAEVLPDLSSRALLVDSNIQKFASGGTSGDIDRYVVTATEDGTIDIMLQFATTTADATIMSVGVYDMADSSLQAQYSTEGYDGNLVFSFDVTATSSYGIEISGDSTSEGVSKYYQLVLSGYDPNESSYMVGAYLSSDILNHGNPVGGTTVTDFTFDEITYNWSGTFEMLFLRVVGVCDPDNQDCIDEIEDTVWEAGDAPPQIGQDPEELVDTADTGTTEITVVGEHVGSVYLMGGLFSSLNATFTAGTLYSSAPVHLQDLGMDTHTLVDEVTVVVNDEIPLILGFEYTEEEPNDVVINGNNYLNPGIESLQAANALPPCSGPPFTDLVYGGLDLDSTVMDWGTGDTDFFVLTTEEEYYAVITVEWSSSSPDLDLHLYGPTGDLWAAGWYESNSNPETITTSYWGFTLVPGEAYYVGIIPYEAYSGANDYTLKIDYVAP